MPYTGIVLALVGAHAGVFLILLAHWVAGAGMFPRATQSLAEVYDHRSIRATWVGLVTFGPLLVLFLQNGRIHNGPLRVLLFAAMFVGILMAFVGSAGLALRIGRNLGTSGDLWQQVLRGGVMLALVFITPVLGWFLMLPVGLASGFGAFLLAKPWRPISPALPPTEPAPAPPF